MTTIRLMQPALAVPRYRQVRMPVVAAELAPWAEVSINDENIEPPDFSWVDLVGLTGQTYNAPRAFFLAEQFRKQGIKTIMGGVFATAMPQKALEHVDAVVIGEVEGLGKEIVNDLNAGNLKQIYQNPQPPDLTHTRAPRWDLMRSNRYYHVNFPMETSRGCPHNCAFCFSSYQYPGFRKRSLDDIERDLGQYDHGMLEIVDLHFAGDRDFAIEVCKLIEAANLPGWYGETTIHSLDNEKFLAALAASRCRQMFVGLESVSPDALGHMNKSFNPVRDYKRILHMCQDYGIYIQAGFIWGADGQGPEDFEETVRFCEEARIYLAGNNLITPYPGTKWHRQLENEGRIAARCFQDYDSAHVVIKHPDMTPAEIAKGMEHFIKRFYALPSMMIRAFQASNKNLMFLIDYFAFNYLYRAYYHHWLKRVRQGVRQPDRQPPKDGLPHLYRNIPLTYTLADWSWRYWEFWLRQWALPSPRPGKLKTVGSIGCWAAMTLPTLLYLLPGSSLPASSPWTVFLLYCLAWWGAAPACWVAGKRLSNRTASLLWGHFFWLPAYAIPILAPGRGLSLATVLAVLNVILVLKNTSFLVSEERREYRLYRYLVFIFWAPVLEFEKSYVLDETASLPRSLTELLIGGALIWGAAGLWAAMLAFFYWFGNPAPPAPAFFALTALKGLFAVCLVSGGFIWLGGWWRAWGITAATTPAFPLRAARLRDFWKWINPPYQAWSHWLLSFNNKKGATTAISTTLPLLLSGLLLAYVAVASGIHEVRLAYLTVTYLSVTICLLFFFLLQTLGLTIEHYIYRRFQPPSWLGRLLTWSFLLVTAPFLFNILECFFV